MSTRYVVAGLLHRDMPYIVEVKEGSGIIAEAATILNFSGVDEVMIEAILKSLERQGYKAYGIEDDR